MTNKIRIDGVEFETSNLSATGKSTLSSLQFTHGRLQELNNLNAVLQKAKSSYIESLKNEILSDKTGFLFGKE